MRALHSPLSFALTLFIGHYSLYLLCIYAISSFVLRTFGLAVDLVSALPCWSSISLASTCKFEFKHHPHYFWDGRLVRQVPRSS